MGRPQGSPQTTGAERRPLTLKVRAGLGWGASSEQKPKTKQLVAGKEGARGGACSAKRQQHVPKLTGQRGGYREGAGEHVAGGQRKGLPGAPRVRPPHPGATGPLTKGLEADGCPLGKRLCPGAGQGPGVRPEDETQGQSRRSPHPGRSAKPGTVTRARGPRSPRCPRTGRRRVVGPSPSARVQV